MSDRVERAPAIVTRAMLVEEARKLVGRPFVHQGRSEFGIDCVGVAALPMLALGLPVYDLAAYDRYSAGEALPRQLALIAERIELEHAQAGDILTFPRETVRLRNKRPEEHFAWLVDRWRILHAWDKNRGVVETEFDERWRRRHVGTWRLKYFSTTEVAA